MRRLRFNTPDGIYIEGVSSTRNYFFFELKDIVELATNKNTVAEREFICYFDNEIIFKDEFQITNDLEEQIKNKMKKNSKESVQHLNEINSEIHFNNQFKEFLIKFDEKMCNPDKKPFPFSLDIYKQKKLFDSVYEVVEEHIYLELMNIIKSIDELFNFLVNEGEMDNNQLNIFMNEDTNFYKVCKYVPTKLKSIGDSRIETIYPSMKEYQKLQDSLFKELPFFISFEDCMNLQRTLISDFYNEYHNKMFESVIIDSSEMLEHEVIYPIIMEYRNNVDETLSQYI